MVPMETIFFLAMTVCMLFSFSFGLRWFFGKKIPRFALMVIFGSGSAMLGRLFETLLLFIRGEIPGGFHVGLLGVMGSFLFFLAANYGTMDSLVDDGSRSNWKYRLIALAAPAVVLALYILFLRRVGFGQEAIVNGVLTIVIMFASYYHLKHLIIPDVEGGIIRHIRPYNLIALVYTLLCMNEMAFRVLNVADVWRYVLYACFCVVYVLFIPVLYKGVKKWTI